MRALLLLLSLFQIVNGMCQNGFDIVQDECRGKYATISSTWDEASNKAIAACNAFLGHPIIIHNDEDQKYWSAQSDEKNYMVTGIVCNASSKLWEWSDGSVLDYKPEPGNYVDVLNNACSPGCTWDMHDTGFWGERCATNADMFDIFCVIPLRQQVPSDDGCEAFEDDTEDGVCYLVGATAETWLDAQMICQNLGANLASIHNAKENSFLRRLAVSRGAVNGLFLGATISGKGKDFGWIDGSEWDYQNFYPGFPISGLGDCLAMDTTTSAGQWMNIDCATKLPVACIREPRNVTEPTCDTGLAEEEKIITSPGFPYNASIPCDYFLSVEEGNNVEVEIVFLEANPCCDFVVIHDGFLGGNMFANLTGEVRNVTYTSSSNLMRVSWQPNYGKNVRGLAFAYRGV